MKLSVTEALHMRHRFLRCRYKSEAPSIRFLLDAPLAGGTLIDAGANMGVFSYYLSRAAGPEGRVYAFEAQPELGAHLRAVRETFGLDNLAVVPQALSSAPGTLTLQRPAVGSGRASFDHDAGSDAERLEVRVTTLDDFLAGEDCPPLRFVKCDVEGHELEVFRGAQATLSRDGPLLLFECHHAEAADGGLFDFLAGLGYDGVFFQVEPDDHRSLLRRTRGRYLHYREFARHPYPRAAVRHRNYLFSREPDFLRELLRPERRRP